jgi:SEC-C motif-containing protein
MADNCKIPFLQTAMPPSIPCPCGGAALATCCAPYLSGAAVPGTAEALMRSRYTAFTQRDEAYLRATWHPGTVPPEPIVNPAEHPKWLGLEIKSSLRLRKRQANLLESPDADTVEFVARYKIAGRAHRLHELSRFVREHSGGVARWYYLDGSFPD